MEEEQQHTQSAFVFDQQSTVHCSFHGSGSFDPGNRGVPGIPNNSNEFYRIVPPRDTSKSEFDLIPQQQRTMLANQVVSQHTQ